MTFMRGKESYTAKLARASSKLYKNISLVNWPTVSFGRAAE
jgi:hypothetical protein